MRTRVRYQLRKSTSNGSIELELLGGEKPEAGVHDLAIVENAPLLPDDAPRPHERGILEHKFGKKIAPGNESQGDIRTLFFLSRGEKRPGRRSRMAFPSPLPGSSGSTSVSPVRLK
jgi:hypothetical protein